MNEWLKKLIEHGGVWAGVAAVIYVVGFDNVQAWAVDLITEDVAKHVQMVEQTVSGNTEALTEVKEATDEQRQSTEELRRAVERMTGQLEILIQMQQGNTQ